MALGTFDMFSLLLPANRGSRIAAVFLTVSESTWNDVIPEIA